MRRIAKALFSIIKYMWYGILVMVDPDYVIAKDIDDKSRTDDRDNDQMGSPDSSSK